MASLENARKKINEIDEKMAKLFVERMEAAAEVAEYKKAHGLKIYDKAREDEVIKRNSAFVENEEMRSYYVKFLENNMAVSRSYQNKLLEGMKVAYSGTEGSFAHIATSKIFPTARKIAYGDFASAYHAVEMGECDAAVLPGAAPESGRLSVRDGVQLRGAGRGVYHHSAQLFTVPDLALRIGRRCGCSGRAGYFYRYAGSGQL